MRNGLTSQVKTRGWWRDGQKEISRRSSCIVNGGGRRAKDNGGKLNRRGKIWSKESNGFFLGGNSVDYQNVIVVHIEMNMRNKLKPSIL